MTRPQAPTLPTQEEIDRTVALFSELGKAGSLVDAGGTWPGLLEMRITRHAGEYSIVDGPFSEAKEVVGGYLLLEVPDREAAIALSRRILDGTGDGTCHLIEIVEGPSQD
jgi:hypothetical protein